MAKKKKTRAQAMADQARKQLDDNIKRAGGNAGKILKQMGQRKHGRQIRNPK